MVEVVIIQGVGRRIGKSEVVKYAVEALGFKSCHPFDPGRAAAQRYFEVCGAPPDIAERMASGDLKDTPSEFLPKIELSEHECYGPRGSHGTPRLFMEEFGAFMPQRLGLDWTIGVEMRRLIREAIEEGQDEDDIRIIADSVVWEREYLEKFPHKVVEVQAPTVEQVKAHKTGGVAIHASPDAVIVNDMDGLERFQEKIVEAFEALGYAPVVSREPAIA